MNKRAAMIAAVALLLLAAGLVWTITTCRSVPDQRRLLAQRREVLTELQNLKAVRQQRLAVFRQWEQTLGRDGRPLEDWLASAMPGTEARITLDERRPAWAGWQARLAEVSWSGVRMEGLLRMLNDIARNRPNWRLVACDLEAGPQPGTGEGTLRLEGLLPPAEETP